MNNEMSSFEFISFERNSHWTYCNKINYVGVQRAFLGLIHEKSHKTSREGIHLIKTVDYSVSIFFFHSLLFINNNQLFVYD